MVRFKKWILTPVATLIALWPLSASGQNLPVAVSTIVERQQATSVRDYWTPERLQNAIPLDLPSADVNAPSTQSVIRPADAGSEGFTPAGAPGAAAAAAVQRAAASEQGATVPQQFYAYPPPFTRNDSLKLLYDESLGFVQYPLTTIGKLFFTIPGEGNFVCSASVARPQLLLTARHCIYDGRFFENVIFFPAYHDGANVTLSPGGAGGGWPARILATWGCPCDLGPFDLGFIQVFDDDLTGCGGSGGGSPIEAYTGWLGTAWAGNEGNQPVRHYDAMGYPQLAPFSGRWMVDSQASTAVFDFNSITDTIGIGSDQTGGSSGGPWIVGFDKGSEPGGSPGGNFINGINSYKWLVPARPLEMHGPQFKDYNFNQLRLFAEMLPCA